MWGGGWEQTASWEPRGCDGMLRVVQKGQEETGQGQSTEGTPVPVKEHFRSLAAACPLGSLTVSAGAEYIL